MKAMVAESVKDRSFLMGYHIKLKKYLFCCFLFVLGTTDCIAQISDFGIFHGRVYSSHKFKDYGTGFRYFPAAEYSPYPSLVLNKEIKSRTSIELRASFMVYQQYTGTRIYGTGFNSDYKGGNISGTINYSLFKTLKFESRIKGGIGIGIVPDMYEGEFVEMFTYPTVDSISRGTIKRNFAPLFPAICLGVDFSYRIARRFKISLAGAYQKGFLRITEYDVYYNDGSGKNDQRAKQWGTGDFYGVQLGLRYLLKDENRKKPGEKTINHKC